MVMAQQPKSQLQCTRNGRKTKKVKSANTHTHKGIQIIVHEREEKQFLFLHGKCHFSYTQVTQVTTQFFANNKVQYSLM
jgi:hypothetical protein